MKPVPEWLDFCGQTELEAQACPGVLLLFLGQMKASDVTEL